MARIPEEELERLKREVSLERLAEVRGIRLQRRGQDLVGLCPFHEDHEPSLVISPAQNLWHCLGACQAGGSVVDWVMRAEGVSFRHAVELLRSELPLAAIRTRPVKQSTVRRLPLPVDQEAEDEELLRQVVDFYHQALKESPEALAYLEKRGLRSRELIDHFQLGFANRTLGYRLPASTRKTGAEVRGRLQQLGLFRASGHEHFNGSIVMPIFDGAGRVVEMYGRKITASLRAGTPDHLYLPGRHKGVWNLAGLREVEEVILTEALLDAMSFWLAGHRNVTAAYGVEGFTDDHLAAFQEQGLRRVLIAYDRDAAGDKAAVQLAVKLTAAGLDCFRVQFPQGQDANACLLEDPANAPERFARLIRKAVWLGQGKPPELRRTLAPTKPEAAEEVTVQPEPPYSAAEPRPPAASPPPPPPPPELLAEVSEAEVIMRLGERRWRVRGLEKNTTFDLLRVNLLVSREGAGFHVDSLDLYSARARAVFLKQAAEELRLSEETLKHDLGQVLLRLEGLVEEQLRRAQEPQTRPYAMSAEEEHEALELLKDPRLLERVLEDFERCGVVGEETNKLVLYLACTSRLLERPLAVVVQSSSAAGKSWLLEAVLAFLPSEERVKYSALTGQSLFYLGERDLAHKVLAVVEEAGAERAAYALKLLQSEGELSIASTGKDPSSGRLVTQEYRVQGPVAILLTTTAVEVDEELLNRCLLLTVDEERAQTRAIHARQREQETLEGLLQARERERVLRRQRNAQRLLRPLLVANPYAEQLSFAAERTRSRRDHLKYLALIRSVALLHQHQRPLQTTRQGRETVEYIEATLGDIALANRLAHEVLGRSLEELPPGAHRLLLALDELVGERQQAEALARDQVRFSRRQLRERLGWGDTQLKSHLARLVDLEYLLVHRQGQAYSYELLWDGQGRDGRPHLAGLVDPAQLTDHAYDSNRSGSEPQRSGAGRRPVGPWTAAVDLDPKNAVAADGEKTVVAIGAQA